MYTSDAHRLLIIVYNMCMNGEKQTERTILAALIGLDATALELIGHACRFWAQVDRRSDDDCWPWLGATTKGYGSFSIGKKKLYAHRFAWELYYGHAMPDDRLGLHECDNPPCCNPRHVRPGTHKDNITDAATRKRLWQQSRTHCPKGHPYEGDNLIVRKDGGRACRECRRLEHAERYRREESLEARQARGEWSPRKPGQSGFYGVLEHREGVKRFQAYITLGKKRVSLGYFSDPRDAAAAYNEAEKERHGERAILNDL